MENRKMEKGVGNPEGMNMTKVTTDIPKSITAVTKNELGNNRDVWSNKMDFLVSCMGAGIGFGNVWRFPYLCYKNGGGAFLIPYLICVFFGGIPLFFLEVSLGQYTSLSGVKAWEKICPLMKGIGASCAMIQSLINVYYNVILAWSFYYFFASFTSALPWSHCNNDWNTAYCSVSGYEQQTWNRSNFSNSVNDDLFTHSSVNNQSKFGENDTIFIDPATEYWERKVLAISSGIIDVGSVKWDLALCLLLCWVLTTVCVWNGIKVAGKIMYVTVIVPYALLAILLVRGLTLTGAMKGITFYIIPDWNKLLDTEVWSDAGTQVLFSYAVCNGTLVALGSYNKYHHNCFRDSIVFSLSNSLTSIFAGFTIFSVLGFMAQQQGVSVADVAESGPGLAFVMYPKAVAQMPFAPFWSVLFFMMLMLLGLGCQIAAVESVLAAIIDSFPLALQTRANRKKTLCVLALLEFLIGLSMVTNGGIYVLQIFDYFAASRMTILLVVCECVTVSYFYGIEKYYNNLTEMLGFTLNPYMKINWMVATPIYAISIFVLGIYDYTEVTYNRTYSYPGWVVAIGWVMAGSTIITIPLMALLGFIERKGTFSQRLKALLSPAEQNRHETY